MIYKEIKFTPFARQDGRFSVQIKVNNEPTDTFVRRVETSETPMTVITTDKVTECASVYSLEECEFNCNWLNKCFIEGRIV